MNEQCYKPLDFVVTPKGNFAIIKETNTKGSQASIEFIGKINGNDKNAWWSLGELTVIDSLPRLLASMTRHPFGGGQADVEYFFGREGLKE